MASDKETLDYIRDLLRLTREHEIEDDLRWLVEADGTIRFYVLCSDTFAWGCADAEDVTPGNFPLLKQTCEDCEEIDTNVEGIQFAITHVADLFAARIRKIRPQGACYKRYPRKMWPLFNACGSERPLDFGNPKPIPE